MLYANIGGSNTLEYHRNEGHVGYCRWIPCRSLVEVDGVVGSRDDNHKRSFDEF